MGGYFREKRLLLHTNMAYQMS